jgi:hypothetical protein
MNFEILQLIHQAYRDDAIRRAAVFKWWKSFRDGETKAKAQTACSTILLKLTANDLRHVFEKWVERCKKCIACQGRYFEKDVTASPQTSDSE